ncbi:MAG: hypothetical protein M3R45_05085 [Pseudomonadota bacterium]|nr:hypothetical protein [Pseudomonadota bacterium]
MPSKTNIHFFGSLRSGELFDLFNVPPIQNVIDRIQKMPNTTDKLDVTGVTKIPSSDDVIKVNTLTFSNFSTLMLLGQQHDYLVIAAKRLVLDIVNPDFKAKISRPTGSEADSLLAKIDGSPGTPGQPGIKGVGETNRNGNPGGSGGEGGHGGHGSTLYVPPLFFFIKEVIFGTASDSKRRYLEIDWSGYRGGAGGNGGIGGDGGAGAHGKEGATSAFDCKEGPGRGGRGGDAGRGGDGGDAGNGSDGGMVFLFAPKSDIFDFATADVEPGNPSAPSLPGRPGQPGRPGTGGGRNGWCGSGPDGSPGATPPLRNRGNPGSAGTRGKQFVLSRDIF